MSAWPAFLLFSTSFGNILVTFIGGGLCCTTVVRVERGEGKGPSSAELVGGREGHFLSPTQLMYSYVRTAQLQGEEKISIKIYKVLV